MTPRSRFQRLTAAIASLGDRLTGTRTLFYDPQLKMAYDSQGKSVGQRTPDVVSPYAQHYWYQGQGPFILPYPTDSLMIETMAKHSPIAAAVISNIRNEVWRRDIELIPRWGAKCDSCGREYDDDLEALRLRQDKEGKIVGAPGAEDKEGGNKTCQVCGHTWFSRVDRPLRCPNCLAWNWGGGPGRQAAPSEQVRYPTRKAEDEEGEVPETVADETMGAEEGEDEPVFCEDCGTGILREPDPKQKKVWEDFKKVINTHGLDFRNLGEILTDDVTKFDDAYLIDRKEYIIGPDGEIAGDKHVEFLRGPPNRMRMIKDERDRRGEYMRHDAGEGFFTCPIHRRLNIEVRPGRCKKCNAKLIPGEYVALERGGEEDILYIEGEVFHWSEYAPSENYGFSPLLSTWTELKCLTNISRLAGSIYEQYRPPKGYLVFRTRNLESLQAQLIDAEEKMKTNPVYIPKLAVDSEGGERFVEWLPLTNDFNELQTIPLMKELRERIEAVFGVSNIMMADTTTSGGLNNEGLQITVALRTIERRQEIWQRKVLPWVLEALEITDYKLRFPPPVEEDRMAILERRRLNLELIQTVLKMGATIELVNHEDFEFKLTSPLIQPAEAYMMQQQGMGPGGPGTSPAPNDPRNPNADGQDKGGKPADMGKVNTKPPSTAGKKKAPMIPKLKSEEPWKETTAERTRFLTVARGSLARKLAGQIS